MPRFTTLYSGSSGNCAIIESDGRFIMIDMGGTCKATLAGLVAVGLSPKNLLGILITHEHLDHIKGLPVFLKKIKVPILATPGTLNAVQKAVVLPKDIKLMPICESSDAALGCFMVRNFATSHDAACSCGWFITANSGKTAAIATDLGHITQSVFAHLECADLVALEANYDPNMLETGPYPLFLKKRISSPIGHLSNKESATAVARLVAGGCRRVALCHLSKENNSPTLAQKAVNDAMMQHGLKLPVGCNVCVALSSTPSQWMDF